MPAIDTLSYVMRTHPAVAIAVAFLGAACADSEPEREGGSATLSIKQVIDFTTEYHAADPFRADVGADPLSDCTWETAREELNDWGEGAAALFHCADAGSEDGYYPVVVYKYEDGSAARNGIEDRLLANDSFLFVEDSVVVDSFDVEDASARTFFEALIKDCQCGEILTIGEDL